MARNAEYEDSAETTCQGAYNSAAASPNQLTLDLVRREVSRKQPNGDDPDEALVVGASSKSASENARMAWP